MDKLLELYAKLENYDQDNSSKLIFHVVIFVLIISINFLKNFINCMKTIFNYQAKNSLCDSIIAAQKNFSIEKKITKFEITLNILDLKMRKIQQKALQK